MFFNKKKKKALLTKHIWLILRDNKEAFDREFRTKQKLIRLMQEKIILEKINLSSYKNKSVLLKNMKNDFHFF